MNSFVDRNRKHIKTLSVVLSVVSLMLIFVTAGNPVLLIVNIGLLTGIPAWTLIFFDNRFRSRPMKIFVFFFPAIAMLTAALDYF